MITIHSLVHSVRGFEVVQLEISLIAGLPQVIFLGGASPVVKESGVRIKSAVRTQKFKWPVAQQVIVNVKPDLSNKKAEGIDLAVALGYLHLTGQRQIPTPSSNNRKILIYGGVSLDGGVFSPPRLASFASSNTDAFDIITGPNPPVSTPFTLKNLSAPYEGIQIEEKLSTPLKRPAAPEVALAEPAAMVAEIISAGEHSLFVAGPAGSGKSTLGEVINALLEEPNETSLREIKPLHEQAGKTLTWRPFCRPHPSITLKALVGGGLPLRAGEVTLAHRGVLFMDEFLEFDDSVHDALRGPLEEKTVRVVRGGNAQNFPADFLLMATTNLCPCGDFVPGELVGCRFSLRRCRSYLDRLSGPIVDRFDVAAFSTNWLKDMKVPIKTVQQRVSAAIDFRISDRKQFYPNSKIALKDWAQFRTEFKSLEAVKEWFPLRSSLRRDRAMLQVARTLADLESSGTVGLRHLEAAMDYTVRPFCKLKRGFDS